MGEPKFSIAIGQVEAASKSADAGPLSWRPRSIEHVSEPAFAVQAEELVRDLREGLADAREGRVFSADQLAADLAARRAAGG
jgi:hypothetical protein